MVKKLFSLLLVCLIVVSVAHAAEHKKIKDKNTKEYLFAYDVLQSLSYCDWGLKYATELQKGASPNDATAAVATVAESLLNQNGKYHTAKSIISKHFKSKNEWVSRIAEGMTMGIDLQLEANNRMLKRLKMASERNPGAHKGFEYEMGEVLSMRKQGWEIIGTFAPYVYIVVKASGKNENTPLGDLPYKITEDERINLLQIIDTLFGDALNRYYQYREATEKGLPRNPEDQTYLIVAVDSIKKNLSVKDEK